MNRPARRLTFLEALQAIGVEIIENIEDANIEHMDFEDEIEESNEDEVEERTEEDTNIQDQAEEDIPDILPDIEVFSEDENSSDDENNDDHALNVENENNIIESGGVQYSRNPFQVRRQRRNILTEQARILANPQNEKDAFLLFYNIDIILHILRETNRKAHSLRHENNMPINSVTKDFTHIELEAGLAIIIRAGLDRDNMSDLRNLWNPIEGRPFYRIVMPVNRFIFLLRCMRFDNFRNRQERQQNDRLSAIREVWDMFNDGLRRVYVPNEALTVDEQLVGYRGNIPGRTYMPCKPRKYGIKFFWICESSTGFALKGMIYTGRQVGEPQHVNLSRDVVMELAQPFFGTGRDVVMDRYFTSHALACELNSNNLTTLGTIKSNRREIPGCFKTARGRHVESAEYLYDHENKIIVLSFVPKKNKNVLLLSSSHSSADISGENKPEIIKDYNRIKGGVDTLDENAEEFSCIRKTDRWPMLINYNLINVATCNAYIVSKKKIYNGQRKQSKRTFLHKLSHQLAKPYVQRRAQNMSIKMLCTAKDMNFVDEDFVHNREQRRQQQIGRQVKRARCHRCQTITRTSCGVCKLAVCPRHRRQVKLDFCQTCN